jgi:hypothetical protein
MHRTTDTFEPASSVALLHEIGLKPVQIKAVQTKARKRGQTAPEYLRSLVERDLLSDKSFDEILRPIREDFRKSGVTESELDQIVDRARNASARKTRKRRR